MNSDSLQMTSQGTDSSAAAPVALPTAEELGLHIATGKISPVTVGDTFEIPVTVSWSVQGSTLLLVPVSTANAKGLDQIGVRQELSRSVKGGKEISENQVIYMVVAKDTGSLTVPALRLEIPTKAGAIELQSQDIPVRVNSASHLLPFAMSLVICVLGIALGLWRIRSRAKAKAIAVKKRSAEEETLRGEFFVLKTRVKAADSRDWLLSLEKVCKCWAEMHHGSENLEALAKQGTLKEWAPLLDEFTHARYGGGERDAFMNLETWKLASKLMQIQEDEE